MQAGSIKSLILAAMEAAISVGPTQNWIGSSNEVLLWRRLNRFRSFIHAHHGTATAADETDHPAGISEV